VIATGRSILVDDETLTNGSSTLSSYLYALIIRLYAYPASPRQGCNSNRAAPRNMSVFQSGSKALITGGASGIGLAVAEFCLKLGMRVSLVDFNEETLGLAEKRLEGDVQILKADVGKEEDWRVVREKVGDVDFLMLNAGIGGQGSWGDAEYFSKVSRLAMSLRDNNRFENATGA
jgi:hypothetical protein